MEVKCRVATIQEMVINELMRQVPLEQDINIAVNGPSLVVNLRQERLFMAMLISRSRDNYLILFFAFLQFAYGGE